MSVAENEDGLPSQEDYLSQFIWGTQIPLQETMNAFHGFLKGFKLKYRAAYNAQQAKSVVERGGIAPPPMSLYDNLKQGQGEQALYMKYITQMRETGITSLNLDLTNILAFPSTKKLYNIIMSYPQECIPIMDSVLRDVVLEQAEEELDRIRQGQMEGTVQEYEVIKLDAEIEEMTKKIWKCRPFGGEQTVNMRDLNPSGKFSHTSGSSTNGPLIKLISDTDKIVSVKGLVIRATPVIPDMNVAFFRCLVCQHTMEVEIDRGRIAEPDRCPRDVCNLKGTMSLIHNRCSYIDKQVIRLQETPDAVPDGQTPHTVSLCIYDEMVDLVKPGDRVIVTGVFRSTPVRVNPRQRSIKSLFKTYLDAVHVKRTNVARMGYDPSTRGGEGRLPGVGIGGEDDEDEALSKPNGMDVDEEDDSNPVEFSAGAEMEQKLLELSRNPEIYDLLARSMAPSIYEMDDVKKGILLQLFGGTNKSISRGGGGGGPRYRGDINILMVGDPGTSKSQILQYVHKIAPRGVYTSGKGSSAVGLTAYVTRDPDSKQLVLESGALVLSDGGVCCIDEFDKMSDATRSVLHEVMVGIDSFLGSNLTTGTTNRFHRQSGYHHHS